MKKKSPYQLGQGTYGWEVSCDFASLYPTTMLGIKIHKKIDKKILRSSKINEIWKKIKE